MKLKSHIVAPIPEADARERSIAFFTRAGYKLTGDFPAGFRFKRGSLIGTYSNFNPLSWAADAQLNILPDVHQSGSGIKVELRITADPFEKRFAAELASAELRLLEAAVMKNEAAAFDVTDLRKRITANAYRTIGLMAGIIISAFLGVLGGSFLNFNTELSPAISAASGAGIFLVLAVICLAAFKTLPAARHS